MTIIDPIKLCCGNRRSAHTGPVCPDGKVMCCHCFSRFLPDQLAKDADGTTVDVCQPCWERDNAPWEQALEGHQNVVGALEGIEGIPGTTSIGYRPPA